MKYKIVIEHEPQYGSAYCAKAYKKGDLIPTAIQWGTTSSEAKTGLIETLKALKNAQPKHEEYIEI